MSSERKAEAPYIHRGRPHLHGRLMQRTPRRCMVRVRGGEAYIQVPAAHPIRERLVMGQWEQERSIVETKATGFNRGRHALWSMGFGEGRRIPIGEGKDGCLGRDTGPREG